MQEADRSAGPEAKKPIGYRDVLWGGLVEPLIVAGVLAGVDQFVGSGPVVQFPINLAGMAISVAGLSLSAWCMRVVAQLPHERSLVDGGPWARVRHPIYLAALLINLGAVLLVGTRLMFAGFALYLLIELLAIRYEERGLRRRFGEQYTAYARRVPMLVPRRSGERRPIESD